jgi:hypothetical protein
VFKVTRILPFPGRLLLNSNADGADPRHLPQVRDRCSCHSTPTRTCTCHEPHCHFLASKLLLRCMYIYSYLT